MERVLDVYRRPHGPARPVICMNEQPKQLIAETRMPLSTRPGSSAKIDCEYVRRGMGCVWMFNEPLGGWRDVRATTKKTAVEWAGQVRSLIDHPRYADVERITLVCDQLNTHKTASFYQAFPPTECIGWRRRSS